MAATTALQEGQRLGGDREDSVELQPPGSASTRSDEPGATTRARDVDRLRNRHAVCMNTSETLGFPVRGREPEGFSHPSPLQDQVTLTVPVM